MPRWLKLLIAVSAGFILVLTTLPWWLGAAARPLLGRWDIVFRNYRPVGYGRFQLDEIRYAGNGVTVVVRGVEAATPLFWLNPTARAVSADSWQVDAAAPIPAATHEAPGIDGLPALHTRLVEIAGLLHRWLPVVTLGPGEINWSHGGITLAGAEWRGGTLTAKTVRFLNQEFDLQLAAASGAGPITAEAVGTNGDAQARLEWNGDQVTGQGTWLGQPVALSARFAASGWLPPEASVRAENWVLPAEQARLGALYTELTGSGVLRWRDESFDFSLQARATPKEGEKAPALEAHLEAHGNRQALTVTVLQVDAPFAQATLSAPVILDFAGRAQGEPAELLVEADLARQPWIDARGHLKGSITVTTADPAARQEFHLSITEAAFGQLTAQQAELHGSWQWPLMTLTELAVRLDDTSHGRAAGTIDWAQRRLEGVTLEVTAQPAWFARWLPEGATWTEAVLSGTLEGPLDAPHHTGELRVTGAAGGVFKPIDLIAQWSGRGQTIDPFTVDVAADQSRLHAAGLADRTGLELRELNFAPAGGEGLTLAAPTPISWSPVWQTAGGRLQGTSSLLAVDVQGGEQGTFQLTAENFDPAWIRDWLDLPGPAWRVQHLQAEGKAVDDFLHFSTTLAGEIHQPGQAVAQVSLAATGDQSGVRLTNLEISSAGQILTRARGRLPVVWAMQGQPHLRTDDAAPLELTADIQSASPLWAVLTEPWGLTITGASAEAQVGGTLKEPQGKLQATIARLRVVEGSRFSNRLPEVSNFSLSASADRAQVRIDSLTARVEGQAFSAQARLAMDGGRWRQWWTEPAEFNWQEAEAVLEIPGADLAPLASRLPAFLAARGRLQARVQLARGGNLSGSLQLADAATRPLPGLGVVQEINARLSFAGRKAQVESFTAKLGGEPVTVRGAVTFPVGAEPQVALRLTGKNLPLVRQAGLLVRSDLDLQTETGANGIPRITGVVNLRDCLVLSDLSALLPTGRRGVRRLPPYFSVEPAPFNRWVLAVEVRGTDAVRVRTPIFIGTASARFALSGTLGEPQAVGEVTIEEGRMFFPFATFTVQNGYIRLPAADPFHAQLNVGAVSHRFNYELRLEVTGTPETPALAFSSNPPLEAGQVLLMVMAGQVPANEVTGATGAGGLRLTLLGTYLGQGIYRGLGGTGENRLEIAPGEQISRQGRETYELAYRLGEHWSLVGEYDEYDNYNAGLKWRVYTQEGSGGKP